MTIYTYRFDFEVGNLVKSPCKECERRKEFPGCIDECDLLDQIQTTLAGTRSVSRSA